MAKLAQNQNQFRQSSLIGQVVIQPGVDTESCQINPSYAGSILIQAGTAVKLSTITGPQILVEPCSSPTDGPVYGVISYNPRLNTYNPGDYCEVACDGCVLHMVTGAAITRGTRVAVTNSSSATADPTVATDPTNLHYTVGFAIGQATAAGSLIRVKIKPALNIIPNATSTCTSVVSP